MATGWTNQSGAGPGTKFGSGGTSAAPVSSPLGAASNALNNTQFATGSGGPLSPATIILALIGILVILKLTGEHARAEGINPAHIHIGGYNLLTITLTAIIGIVGLKVVFNRWNVFPQLTNFVNAA